MSRAARIAALIIAVLIAVAGLGVLRFQSFLSQPLALPDEGIAFAIPPGRSFGQISNDLAALGVIDQPDLLRWYGRLSGKAGAVQAGEYIIEAGLTPSSLVDMFVSGNVRLYSFTIVEGWTYRELLAALVQSDNIVSTQTYEDWPALLESLGSDRDHPEGLFLPETYHFPNGSDDVEILRQAYVLMQQTLAAEWENRATGLPLKDPYEALILASIVEKETALAAERPRISGVFVRRLQEGMRLQTDPTVIYGIGPEFNGNLTRRDLRTDTPYNTYTRSGLPPTPIALPGQAAINAAVQPAAGSELYFVATGLADGSHKFSDTKEQHDAAVQEYLRRLRAARDNQPGQD